MDRSREKVPMKVHASKSKAKTMLITFLTAHVSFIADFFDKGDVGVLQTCFGPAIKKKMRRLRPTKLLDNSN